MTIIFIGHDNVTNMRIHCIRTQTHKHTNAISSIRDTHAHTIVLSQATGKYTHASLLATAHVAHQFSLYTAILYLI